MITTFIDNRNFNNSKTFVITKNIDIDKLCKNKLNFIPKKVYNDFGIELKFTDKIPRTVYCCRSLNESYNLKKNYCKKKKDIEYLDIPIKSCKHNWKLGKHYLKDHVHNFGNGKQYKYQCLLCKKVQIRDYINPFSIRKKKYFLSIK